MKTMAKKKREPFTMTQFTTNTVKYVSYFGMGISVIICLPLIAVCGCWVFISGLIEAIREGNEDG